MTSLYRRILFSVPAWMLLVPGAALAAGVPGRTAPSLAAHVSRVAVVAESFRIRDLPPPATVPPGPLRTIAEGEVPMGDVELENLRETGPVPRASDMAHITVDPSARLASPQAPLFGVGFEGVTQHGYIPGEPTCAAGPNQIFDVGNVTISIANKDGSGRTEVDGASFFGAPASEGAISDPKCFYDAMHGRFLALAFTISTSPVSSFYYLAISKTSDARGDWWRYKFDMTKDGSVGSRYWSDFPGLGISNDKLVMSGQQFDSLGAYKYQKLRVIDRAAAYSGGAVPYVDFYNFPSVIGGDVSSLFVTKPGRNTSPNDTVYCCSVRYNGGGYLTFRTITGPPTAPVLSTGRTILCSPYALPANSPQLGTTNLLASGDCRTPEFQVRNGMLHLAFHFGLRFNVVKVNMIRYLKLRVGDQKLLTDESFGADSTFYTYPASTVDSAGAVFIGFDRSRYDEYASSWGTGKRRSDSVIEPSVLLKTGVTGYAGSRWGDYTGIDLDEASASDSASTAWYAGQFAKAGGPWGAWISPLTFTYGTISGTVFSDCDSSAATSGDRAPLAGLPLQLKQGAALLANTTTDGSGRYRFGYLESGLYDVLVAPAGGAVDAVVGSGGSTQTRVSAGDIQVNLTNTQASRNNNFIVGQLHGSPTLGSILPNSKTVGDPGFTLTLNGTGFATCALAQVDGAARVTTFVNSGQLTAVIPATDLATPGVHQVRVFNPAGGISAAQPLTVSPPPDVTPPVVTVTSPNGGESWTVGSVHSITWSAADSVGVDSVNIDYSVHGLGGPWAPVAHSLANSGTRGWTVPAPPTDSAAVRVIAYDPALNAGADAGDSLFHIVAAADTSAPLVIVTSPNGGERWPSGTAHNITWIAADNVAVDSVSIDYSVQGLGGPWAPVAHSLANSGSYGWTVPATLTDSAAVRVTAYDQALNAGMDENDSLFSITSPVVAVDGRTRPVFALLRPVPNPSTGQVALGFSLERQGQASVAVLDVNGRLVWRQDWPSLEPGVHQVRWSGRDMRGSLAPAGIYFVRLTGTSGVRARKLIRLP